MDNIKNHIPNHVIEILNRLTERGYDAYLVGGCIRDILIEKAPNDFDIGTNALVSEIFHIFEDYKIMDYGAPFGSLVLFKKGFLVEVTTFRTETGYSDLRRPDHVVFTNNIYDDLKRRDFTINSMAWSPGTLIDPFGGKKDVEDGIIRATGNPFKRFSEDPLRMLRALRFACTLDFEIEELTKRAILKHYRLLKTVSHERIIKELMEIFSSENPVNLLLEFYPVMELLIPSKSLKTRIPLLEKAGANPLVGLALLLHPCCQRQELHRMRISRKDIILIEKYSRLLGELKRGCYVMAVRAASAIGASRADAIKSMVKSFSKDDDFKRRMEDSLSSGAAFFTLKDLAIGGKDLLEGHMVQGKDMGKILNTLMDSVIEGSVENNRDALIERAKLLINR